MRLWSVLSAVTLLVCIGVLVFICSTRARDKGTVYLRAQALAKQLTELDLSFKENNEKLLTAKSDLQKAEALFAGCQKNNAQVLTDIETARETSHQHKTRADELEQKIQKLDASIQAVQESIKTVKSVNSVSPTCKPSWSSLVDTNSVGGILREQAYTLAECLSYCIGLPTCIAVDYNRLDIATKSCWFHTSPIGPTDIFLQRGTTQYRIKRTCDTADQVRHEDMPQAEQPNRDSPNQINQKQNQDVDDQNRLPVIDEQSNVPIKVQQALIMQKAGQQMQQRAAELSQKIIGQQGRETVDRLNVVRAAEQSQRQNVGPQGPPSGNQRGEQANVDAPVQQGWYVPVAHQPLQAQQDFANNGNMPRAV